MDNHGSYKQLINIWIFLMFLTFITVYVAQFDFGALNVPIALLVASIKAGVVALHFMHLKHEDGLTWVFASYPIFLLFLLIAFTATDMFSRVLN
ncbi:MAG: cytochrome C oxidase subunit IV family protein [Thermodesulfobacteriota bacterium]|jgi:cytochrome c oxidase subunit 4|nr:cytochrome C oxidase subunit IV family protein [Deltaproteobacteria bacterium TMED58]RZP16579.1 MAG: cytochrome-c oxidase [Candidatus Dadabacteria bacterium]|tara:strand:- start:289 stop:570 length:282 start_codon:yes stop_codon:yes gene_type:complete